MNCHKRIGTEIGRILCMLASIWMTGAQAGAYMGAAMGQSLMDDKAAGATVSVNVDNETLAWKIFGGGFKKYWGVEGAWVALGDTSDKNSAGVKALLESEGFSLQGLGMYPFLEGKLMPYAKLGFIAWDQDLRFTNGLSRNDDGTDGTWGAGIWWRPNNFFGMRVEWEYFDLQTEVQLISASPLLHFN